MAKEQNGTAMTTETVNGNLVLVREPKPKQLSMIDIICNPPRIAC